MMPIAVLIGRTNVGKSTLFNVLTKTRNALVANHPGLTRDRQYGYCKLSELNRKIMIIDTAGLDIKSNQIEKKSYQQALIGIEESHIILFIVDAHDGLMPQEYEIAKQVRQYKKKTILIINKIDGIHDISKINEFYSLGFKTIQKISANHNQGINDLYNKHLIPWINKKFKQDKIEEIHEKNIQLKKIEIKVACIGRSNSGKSTLINRFLKEERMITSNIPGTTLDSISIPMRYNNNNYTLIDTAGTSKKKKNNDFEKFSIVKTFQTIEKSNIVLLIIDANIKICHQELSLIDFIVNSGKGMIIIINKWDLLSSLERKKTKQCIKSQLKFISFSRIHFISALLNKGIFKIFKSIHESFQESKRKISTSILMKIMHAAVKKHQPPIIKGNRIKLKYAHLGSSNPPKIIIHGNQLKHLSSSYKRYLMNSFYNSLQIKGTPIQIEFKDSLNPYKK